MTINYDNVIGLEEAISALKTVTGSANQNNMNVSAMYSAQGVYEFNSSTGILTANITHSAFPRSLSNQPGETYIASVTFSGTTMTLTEEGEDPMVWSKLRAGTGGAITGVWENVDPTTGDIYRVDFSSTDNTYLSINYKSDYETSDGIFHVRKAPMTVDGNFSDWNSEDRIYIDDDGADCGDAPGKDIKEIYLAQDTQYFYLRFVLNGPPDINFGYKFGQNLHTYIGKDQATGDGYIFYATPVGNGVDLPATDVNINTNQIEFRVNLCNVNWNRVELDAWLNDNPTTCRDHVTLPEIEYDRAACNN